MACDDRIEIAEDGAALARRLGPLLAGVTLGLAGPGQYFGRVGAERVTLFRAEPGPPDVLWDGPVLRAEVPALLAALAALGPVLPGETDSLHATAWRFAWSVPPAPALVIDREGVALRAIGDAVEVGARRLERAAIARVEATLSRDWVERQVALVLAAGERLVIAEHDEHFVSIDPTYDGIDLMVDGAWAPALARAVSTTLGVPLAIDADYR